MVVIILAILTALRFLTATSHIAQAGPDIRKLTNGIPFTFTDSNGVKYTVRIGGVRINGTNIVITNFTLQARSADSHRAAPPINQPSN